MACFCRAHDFLNEILGTLFQIIPTYHLSILRLLFYPIVNCFWSLTFTLRMMFHFRSTFLVYISPTFFWFNSLFQCLTSIFLWPKTRIFVGELHIFAGPGDRDLCDGALLLDGGLQVLLGLQTRRVSAKSHGEFTGIFKVKETTPGFSLNLWCPNRSNLP
jgi:hypothetical protein